MTKKNERVSRKNVTFKIVQPRGSPQMQRIDIKIRHFPKNEVDPASKRYTQVGDIPMTVYTMRPRRKRK